MALTPRKFAIVLLLLWVVFVLLGKGGFVHLLLMSAIAVASVDAVSIYRSRMKA